MLADPDVVRMLAEPEQVAQDLSGNAGGAAETFLLQNKLALEREPRFGMRHSSN